MTYKGEEIKRPTLKIVSEYIESHRMKVSAEWVMEFWRERKWKTRKGEKVKTIEAAVNVCNSIYLNELHNEERKKAREERKREKAERQEREWQQFASEAYHVYTDGSCDNVRTKVGGAGYVILKDGEVVKIKNKGFYPTTNNRMEMLAIISALNSLPDGSNAIVFTDSQYCINVLDGYMHQKNQDLIELFGKVTRPLGRVVFQWVKGHNGNEYNEMADELAFSAYKEMSEKLGKPVSKWMLKTH